MTLPVGIHRGVGMSDYVADKLCELPSLSASGIRTLIESTPLALASTSERLWPFPWEFKDRGTKSTKLGSALHSMLLEGTPPFVIRPGDYKTKKGLPGKNLATEDAQAAIAEAEANGIPWLDVTQEADAVRCRDLAQRKILNDPVYGKAWMDGESEVTMVWRRAVSPTCPICAKSHPPIWCRGRIDRMAPREYGLMFDPKTTGLELHPEAIAYRFKKQGTDFQAAWYRSGFEALHPEFAPDDPKFQLAYPWVSVAPVPTKRRASFVPVSIETNAPYDCCFTPFPLETLDWIDGKIAIACDLFAHWLSVPVAKWPGRPNFELPSVRDWQIYQEVSEGGDNANA